MKSTRDRIIQTLLNHPRSSIIDLASAVGINAISVRHHLSNLQRDGLVSDEEERHGVGRPRHVYSLTQAAIERFPTRYLSLTNRLLDQLKATLPKDEVNKIFSRMATELASNYSQKVKSLPIEERLNTVKELLSDEGFTVEWEKEADTYVLREASCPYYHIGQSHPEVCTVDQTIISSVLAVPVEKINCVLLGDAHCAYRIQADSLEKQS
jgi:DeoR family suf operon transcriptional repressor